MTTIVITHVDALGHIDVISRHRSARAAQRAFVWTLNNGYEQLYLRRGEAITLAEDGMPDVVGYVR